MRFDTETTCHCGADYRGSDHCPECGCEQYESGDCGESSCPECGAIYGLPQAKASSYPYNAGDRVMLGICTWQSPQRYSPALDRLRASGADLFALADQERSEGPVHGPLGPYCRYFKAATVVANDREARIMVVNADDPHAGGHGYAELHADEFNGEEVVPYDEALPTTPEQAFKLALRGQTY